MEWLTEHFEVLLPIAVVLFFVLQRFFVRDEGEVAPGAGEEGEESRRIQEEIRRKIIARQQGRTERDVAYQEAEPPPIGFPRRQESSPPILTERERSVPVSDQPSRVRRSQVPPKPPARPRDLQAELQVQKERLREAREAKADAVRSTSRRGLSRRKEAAPEALAIRVDLRSQLMDDLSTGDSMRRAFLLKEIVDRPIGLRTRPDAFSNWS